LLRAGQLFRAARNAYAWLGGAAFAGSLAFFLHFYAVRLGRTGRSTSSVHRAVAGNVLLFGAFALHHSVLARTGVKQRLASILPPTLERTTYVWMSSVLFFLVCHRWRLVPGALYCHGGPLRSLHRGVQLGGLLLISRATAGIDPLELAGIRQATGHFANRDPLVPSHVEAGGPYRVVRHPIYLGWLLLVFGDPCMTFNRFVFAATSMAYLAAAVPFEERSLEAVFGWRYREYARKVRWRIVPFLY
jgi:methanethiol S-methyltransferase